MSPRDVQVVLGAGSPIKRLSSCTQTGSTLSVIWLTNELQTDFFFFETVLCLSFSACKKPLDSSTEAESKLHFSGSSQHTWILGDVSQFTLLHLAQSC